VAILVVMFRRRGWLGKGGQVTVRAGDLWRTGRGTAPPQAPATRGL